MKTSFNVIAASLCFLMAACQGNKSSDSSGGNPTGAPDKGAVNTETFVSPPASTLMRDLPNGSILELIGDMNIDKQNRFLTGIYSFWHGQNINMDLEVQAEMKGILTCWLTVEDKVYDTVDKLNTLGTRISFGKPSINTSGSLEFTPNTKPYTEFRVASKPGATVRDVEETCFSYKVRVLVPSSAH